MRTFFYLVLQSIGLLITSEAQVSPNLADSFQLCLQQHLKNVNDKGVSAAIIMPNGSIWAGAAGVGKASRPIHSNTSFYGASTSKAFMATCLLKLVETNSLNINAPIYHYLPSSQYPSAYIDSTITVKQLLNHTSGIHNFTDETRFLSSVILKPKKAYAHGECLSRFLTKPSDFPKGTKFNYSNSNYVLLAFILEKVTGKDLNTIIDDMIIQPLNLSATYSSDKTTPNSPAGLWAKTSLCNVNLSGRSHTALLTSMWGPGHMISIPENLARYCQAFIKGQLYTQTSTIKDMLTIEPNSIRADGYGYGLGIERKKYAGDYLYGHTGNLGHITFMFHSIRDNYTIVTMINRFSVSGKDEPVLFKALERIVVRNLTSEASK